MTYYDTYDPANPYVIPDYSGDESAYTYDPANPYVIPDYSGDESASKTRAAIARSEWEDYKQRFQGYEDELSDFISDYDIGEKISEAKKNTSQAYDVATGSMKRNLARYGQTGGLSTQQERGLGLSESAASAGAANQVRDTATEMQTALLSTGLSEFSIVGEEED